MSTITTRAGKGSPLTNAEVDANFTNLNTDKAELSGAAFTGAITTTSTVDGRDVATDGTKLDGIEASADVTDTTNVTAAGALMDSELTSIASVKALNQGVATTDSPTFAGLTTSADVSFGDNDKAIFGAGSDLQVYHDGSNSYITETGTGNLYITASDSMFFQSSDNTHRYAEFINGGAVKLRFDNSDKLHTTATGIDVVGVATMDGLTVDGNATFTTADNTAQLTLVSTDTDALVGPQLNLWRNSGVGTNGDLIGQITFTGEDTVGATNTFATIYSVADQTNNGAEDGSIHFQTLINGVLADRLEINASGNSVFNGNVGINSASPAATLHTVANAGTTGFLLTGAASNNIASFYTSGGSQAMTLDSAGNVGIAGQTSPTYKFDGGFADQTWGWYLNSSYNAGITYTTSDRSLLIHTKSAEALDHIKFATGTAATERLRIESSGDLIKVGGVIKGERGTASAPAYSFSDDTDTGMFNIANADLGFAVGGSERMRIDGSGRLGLGVTPEAWSSIFKVLRVGTGSSIAGESGGTSTWFNTNAYYDGSWKRINTNTAAQIAHTSDGKQEFKVAASGSANSAISWNTAVTINNSGALLVGGTVEGSGAQSGIALSGQATDSNIYIRHASGTGSGSRFMAFTYNTSELGSITQHGTSQVLFNVSSDQRLKENIADADDAGSKIDAIQVRKYDWKADGLHQDYGMIAQELQAVVPEAVSGSADSEEMMGVDYSKLVPMLIKEIQSLRNRVAQLEE